MRAIAVLVPAVLILAAPVSGQDFWAHWGDGKAEVNGYSLTQPRYGAKRSGTAVYVFVTEDFSDSLRVKADKGGHPEGDVKPVMQLNAVRDFSTGIYDYNVMTSTFLRTKPGWPVSKVSFSSQEWCGHVWHQIVPREGRVDSVSHSYFDGEANGAETLEMPADGVFEDALPTSRVDVRSRSRSKPGHRIVSFGRRAPMARSWPFLGRLDWPTGSSTPRGPSRIWSRSASGVTEGRMLNCKALGGVTVSTRAATPRGASRACLPTRESGGKNSTANDNLALAA